MPKCRKIIYCPLSFADNYGGYKNIYKILFLFISCVTKDANIPQKHILPALYRGQL